MYYIPLILFIMIFVSCSCFGDNDGTASHDIVKAWIDKEISMPENTKYQIRGERITYDFDDAEFKIVTYIDSVGCSSCHMRLSEWNELINELKTEENVSVNFVMIFHEKDSLNVIRELKINGFSHPITFDYDNLFIKSNPLPRDVRCHTFLLDGNNKVLCVGNPVFNPKIKDLYAKIILDKTKIKKIKDTYRVCINPSIPLGVINVSDTIILDVKLQNKDTLSLHLEEIIPSCDCCSISLDNIVLHPGECNTMRIVVKPRIPSSIFHQTINLYFEEREEPEKVFLHGYVK